MSAKAAPLNVCVALHQPPQVGALLSRVAAIGRLAGAEVHAALFLSVSGEVEQAHVRSRCAAEGITILECQAVDDRFFDFSAYQVAVHRFLEQGSEGALFVNDTLVPKHDSSHLRRATAQRIVSVRSSTFDFPILIGPYRHSEFSFGDGVADEFVATFMFYLNHHGLRIFAQLLETLPAVAANLQRTNDAPDGLEAEALRFCRLHSLQLNRRYAGMPNAAERLARKLATVYAERILSKHVKNEGAVWYAANGLVGRLLVPAQCKWSRVKTRLTWFRTETGAHNTLWDKT